MHDKFIVVLNNNQKGNELHYQRNGQSNKFVTVTGRFLKKFVTVDDVFESVNATKVPLTYVNQAVPSMVRMPRFKK